MLVFENIKPQNLWYVIGLIATDGNLSPDGRHICIVAKDADYLKDVGRAIGVIPGNIISMNKSGNSSTKYPRLQFSSVFFYRFLLEIGVTPRKSLTLGPITVPKIYLPDFLRGVIDGDGGIRCWQHPQNGCEQWRVRISSAAPRFISWLQKEIQQSFCVTGSLNTSVRSKYSDNPLYELKYGKIAAKVLLAKCYYQNALALERKRILALHCIRSPSVWSKAHTVPSISRGGEIGSTHET